MSEFAMYIITYLHSDTMSSDNEIENRTATLAICATHTLFPFYQQRAQLELEQLQVK